MGENQPVEDSAGDDTEILPDTGTRIMRGDAAEETTTMPVAGDGESRPVPPAIPPKGTTPDNGDNETRAPAPHRRRNVIIASSVAAVLVLAGLAGGYAYAAANVNKGMQAAQAYAQTTDRQLADKISEARKLADATGPDMVDDPSVLESLASTLAKASRQQGVETMDANPCMVWTLTAAQSGYDADARDAKTAIRQLSARINGVNDGVAAKTLKDARNALQSAVDSAQQTLDGTDGKVQDNKTRETLKTAIDTAKKTLTDKNANAKAITDQKTTLDAAVKSVNDSKAEKDKADAQAAAAQSSSGSSNGYTGGSYYGGGYGYSGGSTGGYTGGSTSGSVGGGPTSSNDGVTIPEPDWSGDRNPVADWLRPDAHYSNSDCSIYYPDGTIQDIPCS